MLRRLIGLSLVGTLTLVAPATNGADWPAWRGPTQDGITRETGLPESWSASQNITWKVELPGPGNSTPVVSGDRVILTTADSDPPRVPQLRGPGGGEAAPPPQAFRWEVQLSNRITEP